MTRLIDTALCDRLGIDVPIIQAPIGGATTPELAAAVSNAGGLGMLAATWTELQAMREQIRATRRLTDRAFGVNLVLVWDQAERVRIALDEGVRIVSFFWGDPTPHVDAIHAVGGSVLLTVASADAARRAVDLGVDVVVAQGWEAGGHVLGEVSTLALVPAVVDAVGPVPVVAAGGIGDGRGIAAVLALGASGAWLGTRFVNALESAAHPFWRQALLEADETATVHSILFDGEWADAPHRVLRNSTVRAWEAAGRPPSGSRPGEGDVIGRTGNRELVRYGSDSPRQDVDGDVESMSLWAGQSVGVIHDIEPAADIVRRLLDETLAALRAIPVHQR